MTNLDGVLHQLREERGQAQLQVTKLETAISTLEGLTLASPDGVRPTRTVSAAARRRIAAAARARWARVKSGKNEMPRTRVVSSSARRKMAAAQKARWARVRAQQSKKAA